MQPLMNIVKGIGWIDGLVLLAITYLIIRGFVRRASGELSALVSSCAMLAFLLFGFRPLLAALKAVTFLSGYPQANRFLALILIGVASVAVWMLLRKLLAQGISLVIPKLFDHILGGILGGITAVVFVVLLCAFGFLGSTEETQQQAAKRSVAIEKLTPLFSKLTPHE